MNARRRARLIHVGPSEARLPPTTKDISCGRPAITVT